MTIAAGIVPQLGGYCGIVIAEGDAVPLRVVLAESFEVGRLRPRDSFERGAEKTLRREIDEADLTAAVARVVGLLGGATVVTIAGATPLASKLSEAISGQGIEVKRAPEALRKRSGSATPAVMAGFANWQAPEKGRMLLEHAAELLLRGLETAAGPELAAELRESLEVLKTVATPTPAKLPLAGLQVPASAAPPEPTGDAAWDEWQAMTARAAVNDAPEPPAPLAPRSAGLDPGSRKVGLCIAEGDTLPLKCIDLRTLLVGRRVELPKPKEVKKRDGTTYTKTHIVEFDDELVDSLAAEIVQILLSHNVKRLILEHVFEAHLQKSDGFKASNSTTQLLRSMWVSTTIRDAAKAAGIEVVRVRATTWRAKVAGRQKRGGDGAERIPAAIAAGFTNWPAKSDEHERDAAGLALYGCAPAAKEPRKRVPRDPNAPKVRHQTVKASHKARAEEVAQRRAEAGCTCKGKKHLGSCKLAKSKPPKWAAKILEATP